MKFRISRHPSAPPGRATGSTFRLMLQALIEASGGKDVLLVYGTQNMVAYAKHKICDLCFSYFRSEFEQITGPGGPLIRFPNGGSVSLTTRERLYRNNDGREAMVRSGRLIAIWDLKDEPLPPRAKPRPDEKERGEGIGYFPHL